MSNDEHKWLRAALDNDPDETGRNLSEWEVQFIEDLDRRGDGYALSDKQRDCLRKIWEKLT